MAQMARSARGELVNFEIIRIKQQLSAKPIIVGVDDRRRFIDAKDGVKSPIPYALKDIQEVDLSTVPSALQMAFSSAQSSSDEAGVIDSVVENVVSE